MCSQRTEITIRDMETGEEITVKTAEELRLLFGVCNYTCRKAIKGETVLKKNGSTYRVVEAKLVDIDKPNTRPKTTQLCWSCENATNDGCSWSDRLKPVEGWDAEAVYQYGTLWTWNIYDCPLYKKEVCHGRSSVD